MKLDTVFAPTSLNEIPALARFGLLPNSDPNPARPIGGRQGRANHGRFDDRVPGLNQYAEHEVLLQE